MTWRMVLLPAVAAIGLMIYVGASTPELHLNIVGDTAEQRYLTTVQAAALTLQGADDGTLVRVGLGVCAAIAHAPAATVQPQPVDGITAAEVYAVTDAATRYLCTTVRPKVAGYLRDAR